MKIDPSIKNITVSGRIGSGTTTLAKGLAGELNWKLLEGGEMFEKFFNKEKGSDANRPDDFDLKYENTIKKILSEEKNNIIQSHLAGFDAQKIPGVFKIVVLTQNQEGQDATQERAKRLAQRKGTTQKEAEREVYTRENENLKKWRRLYAHGDHNWVYWDKKYYDLVINTYSLNKEEALKKALSALTPTAFEHAE